MLQLSSQDKQLLLGIARGAVRSHLEEASFRKPEITSDSLSVPCGVFVSIHREAQLRGCIGRIEAESPLYQTTAECAVSAAVFDPRFAPVMIEELASLSFEISVLSVLEKVVSFDQLEVGRHGLLVEKDGKRGLLLPQVAVQCGWDRSEFLSQTCEKAGLPPEAWKAGAQIFAFDASVFSEGITAR